MTAPQNPGGTPPQPPAKPAKPRSMSAKTVVIVILVLLLLTFIFVNTQSVDITFWITTVKAPLWIVLAISILVGVAVGFILGRMRYKPPKQ